MTKRKSPVGDTAPTEPDPKEPDPGPTEKQREEAARTQAKYLNERAPKEAFHKYPLDDRRTEKDKDTEESLQPTEEFPELTA